MQMRTVQIPEKTFAKFSAIAAMVKLPVGKLLQQALVGNEPPWLDELSVEMQQDFSHFYTLNNAALRSIVHERPPVRQLRRHEALLQANTEGELLPNEQEELQRLAAKADAIMLKKSFALALLAWRGEDAIAVLNAN